MSISSVPPVLCPVPILLAPTLRDPLVVVQFWKHLHMHHMRKFENYCSRARMVPWIGVFLDILYIIVYVLIFYAHIVDPGDLAYIHLVLYFRLIVTVLTAVTWALLLEFRRFHVSWAASNLWSCSLSRPILNFLELLLLGYWIFADPLKTLVIIGLLAIWNAAHFLGIVYVLVFIVAPIGAFLEQEDLEEEEDS
ncbi:unnamed protein product [Caenorhabditis sp. 36 PRJEB53466]|nr:unnamed protein product [Caenorhabditis sp. 36 PRJEB53466]